MPGMGTGPLTPWPYALAFPSGGSSPQRRCFLLGFRLLWNQLCHPFSPLGTLRKSNVQPRTNPLTKVTETVSSSQ